MTQENNNLINIFSNPIDGSDITHSGPAYAFGCRFCNENFKNLINENTWIIADVHNDDSWNFYSQDNWKITYPIEFQDLHLRKIEDYGTLNSYDYPFFQYLWLRDDDNIEAMVEHRVIHPISELTDIFIKYKQKLTNSKTTRHLWIRLIKPDMTANNSRI